MSNLIFQLKKLNEQREKLEKRISEEKIRNEKLNNNASIERLETLIEPLTNRLSHRAIRYFSNNNPVYGKSQRENLEEQFKIEMTKYNEKIYNEPNNHLVTNSLPPRKNKTLEEEEIFVTIIGILKKQQEEIEYLKKELSK